MLTKASTARIEHLKAEMKESLKIKLNEIMTNNIGQVNLSLLDGLAIDGYDIDVSNLGRIVILNKSSEKGTYFVDNNFNVSEISMGQNGGTTIVGESSYASLKKVSSTNTSVKVALNIPIANISVVNYYIDGVLIHSGPETEYTYTNLDKTKTYTMYATVEYSTIPQVIAKPMVLEGDQTIFINASTGSDSTRRWK